MNDSRQKIWTAERCARAVAVLRATRRECLNDALALLTAEFGMEITAGSLQTGLHRYAGTTIPRELARDFRAIEEAEAAAAAAQAEVEGAPTERQPKVIIVDDAPDAIHAVDDVVAREGAPSPVAPDVFVRRAVPEDETAAEMLAMRLRRENTEHGAARKRLLKELADKEAQIETLRELRAAEPLGPVVARPKVGGMQRQGVPVMLCSDWHVEEPVDPKTVNGLNEYNLEIADACITRMAEAYEWFLRDTRFDCRAGVVWLGGDLFSGYIHDELVEANFLSPTQAVLWLQERLERMLRMIAATCPQLERIIVPCNDGNHGRMTHKIRVSTRTANSLEWLLYKNLAARMADDHRFEFDIADGEWTFVDVFDRRLAFTHGDSFQSGGGVGGISIPIRRGIARQFQHRKADYFNIGHFHQRNDFGDIATNGSMIGYSDYAQRIHAAPEPRQQTWYLVDSERGKAFSAPIWLPQYEAAA